MRRSRAITVSLLSAAMLTAGCGGRHAPPPPEPPDRTWYDANHHPVPEVWEERDGKRVPNPVPLDRYGRPWVQDANGEWGPLPPPGQPQHATGTTHNSTTHSYHHGSSVVPWIWGGNGYRSYSGSSPPPAASRPPAAGSKPSTGGSSSVSRGGFGSTGSSSSAGS